MGIPADDSTFQWIMGSAGAVISGVLIYALKRTQTVEDRLNHRVDAADERIDKFREEVRKEADADNTRLWAAIDAIRKEFQGRHDEIMRTMVTKEDLREMGRRLEAVVARQPVP